MKTFKLNIAVFLAFLIAISSCQKDDILTEPITELEESQFQEGMIQLGEKLENPYTVENMRKAYKNLTVNSNLKSSSINESDIDISHYYVRFLPKSFEELEVLRKDTSFLLFDFPLDYEILEGGTYFHDPDLPDNSITWQYCAVHEDFVFPDIEYEVLAELFLPESIEDETSLKSSDSWTFLDDLEVEALRITGNLDDEYTLKSTMGRKKFKPKGTIRVADNSGLGTIGVHGCKVIATSWFTSKSALTNSSGYFYINHTFKGHCNYKIKWERNDFDIRSGNWGQAYFNGPRSSGDWNLTIWQSTGMSWVYAHIHRGAHTYYYANSWGIKSPPKNGGFLKTRVKIGAMDKSGRAHYYEFNKFFTTPQIKMYRKDSYGNVNTSEELFGTAVHELAHASHWDIGYTYGQYVVDAIFSEPFLPESWAQGVESEITSDVYNDSYQKDQSRTISQIKGNGGYTPIVIDMIDNHNQRDYYGSTAYPIDRVSGYTLKQLEDALYGAYTWSAWRDKIRSKYPSNSSRTFLNELFSNYK